jgi:peptidyl-prolyl cis-trans isomerase D
MSLAQAVKESGIALPPVRPVAARRIEIANAGGQVPPPLQLLFTLGQGKSRMVPDPGGRGLYVVKTNTITPGNAFAAPGIINNMQTELQQGVQDEYARQFMAAVRGELKVRRNESAIAAERARIATSGS